MLRKLVMTVIVFQIFGWVFQMLNDDNALPVAKTATATFSQRS